MVKKTSTYKLAMALFTKTTSFAVSRMLLPRTRADLYYYGVRFILLHSLEHTVGVSARGKRKVLLVSSSISKVGRVQSISPFSTSDA